jgi:hypothetical protein
MSRIRIGLLSLLAVFAFSAVAAGAAQAVVPTYSFSGSGAIKSKSGVSRLWVTKLGTVIVCTASTDTGKIVAGAGTNEKVTVTYTGCKLYAAEWNGSEWVVGSALSLCKVNGPLGEPAETIKTSELKSKLAYAPNSKTVVDYFEPEAGPVFVNINIEGTGCLLDKVGGYNVEGSVVGEVTPINTSSKVGTITFAVTKNVAAGVTQHFEGYQLECKTEPTVPDTLTLGKNPAAIESGDEVELKSENAFEVKSTC